jgi:hypothetical protein
MNTSKIQDSVVSVEFPRKRLVLATAKLLIHDFLSECAENNLTPSLKIFIRWADADFAPKSLSKIY